jgi:hypothetical protein
MPNTDIDKKLKDATYDLKFLLNRRYKKKSALDLITNKYLLNKEKRNYLVRKVFSDEKSMHRRVKIVEISDITNKTVFIDGYNVLISVEAIFDHEYDSVIMCDDGVLRDIKAVFGKYKINMSTEPSLNSIMDILSKQNPAHVNFYYDSPVSKSGELANLTDSIIRSHKLDGCAVTKQNVDSELIKQSHKGIVATSDGPVIDKVKYVLDIPYWICKNIK